MGSSTSLTQDKTFRRIVVGSTGLGIAFMLASLAAVQFGKAQGLQFQWHWSIALVMLLGVAWNWHFWNLLWRAQEAEDAGSRRKLMFSFAQLFALGAGTFLYPVRFVASEHQLEISYGLITALLFLVVMFWVIFKVARAFSAANEVSADELKP
jgi:hypothetical protein